MNEPTAKSDSISLGRLGGRSRWFLAELVVIVTGILLALGIDEWRTNRNLAADSHESLARVASNLATDTVRLARLSGVNQRRVEAIRSILAIEPEGADAPSRIAELIPFVLESSTWIPTGQEYEALQSSGRLGLISNPELLGLLAQYYVRQSYVAELFRLDVEQSHAVAEIMYPHVEFPRDVFTMESRPETTTTSTDSFFPVPEVDPSVVRLLEDKVFVNEMTYLGFLKQLLTNALDELTATADELIQSIEAELDS